MKASEKKIICTVTKATTKKYKCKIDKCTTHSTPMSFIGQYLVAQMCNTFKSFQQSCHVPLDGGVTFLPLS